MELVDELVLPEYLAPEDAVQPGDVPRVSGHNLPDRKRKFGEREQKRGLSACSILNPFKYQRKAEIK